METWGQSSIADQAPANNQSEDRLSVVHMPVQIVSPGG